MTHNRPEINHVKPHRNNLKHTTPQTHEYDVLSQASPIFIPIFIAILIPVFISPIFIPIFIAIIIFPIIIAIFVAILIPPISAVRDEDSEEDRDEDLRMGR